MNPPANEIQMITEAADNYRTRGYSVLVHPQGTDLPDFLKRFSPDLIARSPLESVVVEVASHSTLKDLKSLPEIAQAIQTRPGWRLELIIIPQHDAPAINPQSPSLSSENADESISRARILLEHGAINPSFLTAWAAAEILLNQIIKKEDLTPARHTAAAHLKTLFSQGLLSESQYSGWLNALETRNSLVHRATNTKISADIAQQLLVLTEELREVSHWAPT
jgi:hypothetical protein